MVIWRKWYIIFFNNNGSNGHLFYVGGNLMMRRGMLPIIMLPDGDLRIIFLLVYQFRELLLRFEGEHIQKWQCCDHQTLYPSPSRITSRLLWRLECVAWQIVASHCGLGGIIRTIYNVSTERERGVCVCVVVQTWRYVSGYRKRYRNTYRFCIIYSIILKQLSCC